MRMSMTNLSIIILYFFSFSSFAVHLADIISKQIKRYEITPPDHNDRINFGDYREGWCEKNVANVINLMPKELANKIGILLIERIDEQGNILPFMAKKSRHYYDANQSCCSCLHFLNQDKWPYSLIMLNQCVLYSLGYHSWSKHVAILYDNKVYDVDTKSNGIDIKEYLYANFVHKRYPHLMSQYKISQFRNLDNYIDFCDAKKMQQQFSNLGMIIFHDGNFQISLKNFLKKYNNIKQNSDFNNFRS